MRIYLPQEQYSDVLLRGKVNREGYLREDDYFEAMLVPAGTGEKNLSCALRLMPKTARA